ncbi:MAG: ferredoxin [bacterium]|nr:ferredoxin [bacterium]
MKKLKVNEEKCLGCGACVSLCPKVFKINENGKSAVIDSSGDTPENIETAIAACPVQAILWEEIVDN